MTVHYTNEWNMAEWNETFYLTTLDIFYLRLSDAGHIVTDNSAGEVRPAAATAWVTVYNS